MNCKYFLVMLFTLVIQVAGVLQASELTPKGDKVALGDIRSYVVMVSANPEPQTAYSAKVLSEGIGKLTGYQPPIIHEGETNNIKHCFAVGKTALSVEKEITPLDSEQGYSIAFKDGCVFVLGGNRGPFHGVMALLEEDWGCRWFSRYSQSVYPQKSVTSLAITPRSYVPQFDIREWLQITSMDAEWSLFNRCMNISYFTRTTKEHGGGYCAEDYFFHTYEMLVPWEKYKDTHPEYFMLVGGKRLKNSNAMNDGQFCYTAKGVEDVCVEHFEQALKRYPNARVFGISPNDNLNLNCECPTCTALIAKEGVIGAQIDLANRVARRLKSKYPDLILHTSAYSATEFPPPSIKPDDNVAIFYAPIRDRSNPLIRWRDQKQSMEKKFYPWTTIAKRLYVWDYSRIQFAPLPNFDVMQDNLLLMRERGVKGVFIEDHEFTVNSLDVAKAWVFAKLLWNPSWNARSLLDEFITGFYGPAAVAMRQYADIQLNAYDRYLKNAKPGDGLTITPKEIEAMRHLLEIAYEDAKNDSQIRYAVAREYVSFLVCRLNYCRTDAVDRYTKDIELVQKLTDEHNICITEYGHNLSRQQRNQSYFDDWQKKLKRASGGATTIPVYAPSSVVLTDCTPWLGATKVKEVGAINPVAYRLCVPGDWLLQWDFTDLLAAGGGMQTEFVCRARIKPQLSVTHPANNKALGLHVWVSGREGGPGAATTFANLPKDEWGFVYFFRVNVYSSSVNGYFYTTTETLDKSEHILFDYLEFIPTKDFKDQELLKKLPQILL